VSENSPDARALLEADGYERSWEDWIFDIELEREPDPPQLPPGYAIRECVRDRDERAVYRVVDDAFGEWPDAEKDTFEDWAAETFERPGFLPEHIATVVNGEEIVGVATLIQDDDAIWVAQLAVAREHRGRGLARALLVHSFGVGWHAGLRHCGLSTDSRTGARGLYEHVGMRVTRTFWEYGKLLR
jgi:mycothiol synthase